MSMILYGFKTCGKTTLGKQLADRLGMEWIDTDDDIRLYYEVETGRVGDSMSHIYREIGPGGFEELEMHCINNLNFLNNHVVSLGGGSIRQEQGMSLLKSQGRFVYLHTDKATLYQRWQALPEKPAMIYHSESLEAGFNRLYEEREPLYRAYADLVVDLTGEIEEDLSALIKIVGGTHGK